MKDNTIKCPLCGYIYHRGLYDYYFIRCTEKDCGVFFDKITGKIIKTNSENQVPTEADYRREG